MLKRPSVVERFNVQDLGGNDIMMIGSGKALEE